MLLPSDDERDCRKKQVLSEVVNCSAQCFLSLCLYRYYNRRDITGIQTTSTKYKMVVAVCIESQNTKMPSLHENIDSIKAQGQSVSQAEDLVSVCNMMQTGPMAYEVFFEDFDPTGGNRARKKLASTRSGSAIQNNNRTPVKKSVSRR